VKRKIILDDLPQTMRRKPAEKHSVMKKQTKKAGRLQLIIKKGELIKKTL